MISSEVQRTLVKSPPELWAELSDPAALARHLGELGEIRITATEPEHKVEWEGDGINGTVQIKPSGWGTKVTLSVIREIDAPEETATPPEDIAAPASGMLLMEPTATIEEKPERLSDLEEELQSERDLREEPAAQTSPHRGFFSRLFRRRAQESAPAEPEPIPEPEPVSDVELAEPLPEPVAYERPPENIETPSAPAAPDIAAELKAAEEVAAEEVTAVLTAVLDRLGAAHHRPFSRA